MSDLEDDLLALAGGEDNTYESDEEITSSKGNPLLQMIIMKMMMKIQYYPNVVELNLEMMMIMNHNNHNKGKKKEKNFKRMN